MKNGGLVDLDVLFRLPMCRPPGSSDLRSLAKCEVDDIGMLPSPVRER